MNRCETIRPVNLSVPELIGMASKLGIRETVRTDGTHRLCTACTPYRMCTCCYNVCSCWIRNFYGVIETV